MFTGSFFLKSFCKLILQFGDHCDLQNITSLINKDFESKNVYCKNTDRPVDMTAELIVTPLKLLYLSVPQNAKGKAEALVNQWENIEKNECKPRIQQSQTSQTTGEEEDAEARIDPLKILAEVKKELLQLQLNQLKHE